MKIFSKFMIALMLLLFVNISVSVFTEIEALEAKRDDLGLAIRLAYKNAVVGQQTLDEDGMNNLGAVSSEYIASYKTYLASLKSQAQAQGISTSSTDLYRILNFLTNNVTEYERTGEALYTPLQFSITYVDPVTFEEDFEEYLRKIIDDNYGAPTVAGETENVFRGRNSLLIDDVRINVSGPELRFLDINDNAYAKIFGSDHWAAMDVVQGANRNDAMFNYVVVYDVDIEVDWSSVTATPYFNFGSNKSRPYFKLRLLDSYLANDGQLKIPGPTRTYHIEYVLTN